MREKYQRAQLCMNVWATFLTVSGTVLCLAGLLLPHWYTATITVDGVEVVRAGLGLWQDEICRINTTCQTFWLSDDSYSRPDDLHFPFWKLIQGIETAGTAVAVLSLLTLAPLWVWHRNNRTSYKALSFSPYFVLFMIAGFLCIIGCLVISGQGTSSNRDFMPLLSGIGGALILISVGMSCAVCRYDPSYGTLENPVSPRFSRA